MKGLTILGVVLLLAGIASLITGGFSFTHEKKDVDAGPIQISHDSKEHVPIAPIVSGVLIVAGIGLAVVGAKK
jgi:Mn2+/Fe2+ NRAMP family transporter